MCSRRRPSAMCAALAAAAALPAAAAAAAPRDAPRVRRESVRLAGELVRAGAREAQGRRDLVAAGLRLQAVDAREQALAARIGANRTELIRLLGALERWRSDPPPALLVAPRRAADAARGALLMRAITPELERRARDLSAQAASLRRARRSAAEADAEFFAAESAAADRRAQVDALSRRKAALDAALLSPEEREAQERARRLAAGGLGPLAAGLAGDAPAVPAGPPARLLPPVEGAPVLGWGAPWPGRGAARGLAWNAGSGEMVLAPAVGRVEYAGPLKGWRLVAILRLEGDWRLVLAGLQTVTAAPGSDVAAGQPLGRAAVRSSHGPAPRDAPPPELYVELRHGVEPVDPTRLFAAAGASATARGAARDVGRGVRRP